MKFFKSTLLFLSLCTFFVGTHLTFAQATDNQDQSNIVKPSDVANPCASFNGTTCPYNLLEPLPGVTQVDENFKVADWVNTMVRIIIGIIGILAVIMIIIGGIQYMTTDAIGKKESGKETIQGAIFGIVLALGAYLLLRTINPQLVSINLEPGSVNTGAVHVSVADKLNLIYQDSEADKDGDVFTTKPKALCSGADCQNVCKQYCTNIGTPTVKCNFTGTLSGVLTTSEAKPITGITNVIGNGEVVASTTLKGLQNFSKSVDQLISSKSIASGKYELVIKDAYRPVNRQLELACANISKVPTYVASPGSSNHGSGIAIDAHLKKDGSELNLCDANNSKLFDQIMTKAGWVRYNKEAWHYEYRTSGNSSRCTYPNCPKPDKCSGV